MPSNARGAHRNHIRCRMLESCNRRCGHCYHMLPAHHTSTRGVLHLWEPHVHVTPFYIAAASTGQYLELGRITTRNAHSSYFITAVAVKTSLLHIVTAEWLSMGPTLLCECKCEDRLLHTGAPCTAIIASLLSPILEAYTVLLHIPDTGDRSSPEAVLTPALR